MYLSYLFQPLPSKGYSKLLKRALMSIITRVKKSLGWISYGWIEDQSLTRSRCVKWNDVSRNETQGGRIQKISIDQSHGLLFSLASNDSDEPNFAAQDDTSNLGKIIFLDINTRETEIFSKGHRNPQGLYVKDKLILSTEHGPQGGDEINIISAGSNYGWPVITYGVNYGLGTKIGEGTHKAGMEQPIYKWVPSIAPSGMAFYSGDKFTHWRGNLFVGSLKFGALTRLEIDGHNIINEERLLHNHYGRIRDVVQGPDGLIYLLTDDANGKLLQLSPTEWSRRLYFTKIHITNIDNDLTMNIHKNRSPKTLTLSKVHVW